MRPLFIGFFSLLHLLLCAQGTLTGVVADANGPLPFATVSLKGEESTGTMTDQNGNFRIGNLRSGSYKLEVSYVGYEGYKKQIQFSEGEPSMDLTVELREIPEMLKQVVVTGTRTSKKAISSPVIVDIINSQTLTSTQSVSLSEGLKFQPGLRVETDCQTCNYTQLRMNGLQGGYSQILINSRPIFSPLTGLYGLEQVPTNMIERIEVVRGGGSALYGSGAIGGTVNVITKIPRKDHYDFGYTYQNLDGASEHILQGNATVINEAENAGATFFINRREREWYDANGDNFSEIPALDNTAFGATLFFQPAENQKIDVNLGTINEYRYGGEMVEEPAHLTQQAEERTHNVLVGNVDYQINFKEVNSSLITYFALQRTDRDHYTGIFPDMAEEVQSHLEFPPYGTSDNTTIQGGVQYNQNLEAFAGGSNVITVGLEYVEDDILDLIDAYNYRIDQVTRNWGSYLQSDWEINSSLNLLTGIRLDQHNLVDGVIASPRTSLLYKANHNLQFRATWGTGFRAPQAFDTDLHIAFAGGGVSRVQLSENLKHERSNSFSGSVNYDKSLERLVFGFTVEGFYTHLRDAFFLQPLGADLFGEVFEKQNGPSAVVRGITVETRANYDEKIQLDAGLTVQRSEFDSPVENIEGLDPSRRFLRTPNEYGYGTLTIMPSSRWEIAANGVYTGPMLLTHFAGAPEQTEDVYFQSPRFTEWSLRASYEIHIPKLDNKVIVFGGVKNLTHAYQSDFDSGKNRDSNFVYGPATPRTIFAGLRITSF